MSSSQRAQASEANLRADPDIQAELSNLSLATPPGHPAVAVRSHPKFNIASKTHSCTVFVARKRKKNMFAGINLLSLPAFYGGPVPDPVLAQQSHIETLIIYKPSSREVTRPGS